MSDTAQAALDPTTTPPLVNMDRVSAILYPTASFGLLFLLWQFGMRAFGVPEYILPVPANIRRSTRTPNASTRRSSGWA